MISATRRWLRRNRNPLAITAGVVGVTYLAGQYIVGKISEARERLQLDQIAKDNLRRRFEQNQTDCTITVLALLPTVTENILESLPVEQLTHELQQKKAERLARVAGEGAPSELSSGAPSIRDLDTASLSSLQSSSYIHASQLADDNTRTRPRKSKAQLWNEIKISSVTRSFTLIYTLSLLTLLTRIQLNLLGRLNYLSSVVSLAQPSAPGRSTSISLEDHDNYNTSVNFGNDFETNRRYLTFSWFLLHRGYAAILVKVQAAVTEAFGTISPTEAISHDRLRDLTLSIRKKIEGSTNTERLSTKWLPYLLPPREEEESLLVESGVITPPTSSARDSSASHPPHSANPSPIALRHLLDETADLIDSPTFTRIHTLLLNNLFSHLVDVKVAEQAFPPPPPQPAKPHPRIQEIDSAITVIPAESRVKLATILAVLTRQAHSIGNGNTPPNEYLSTMENEVKELESFAAVIYANNLEAGLEEARPKTADSLAAGSIETNPADEMLESRLEGAWSRVIGSSIRS